MSPAQLPAAELAALAELAEMELSGEFEPLTLDLGPFSAYALTGALQLVSRHPDVGPQLRRMLEDMGRRLQGNFTDPAVRKLLERGWDPAQDVPWPGR